MIKPVQVPQEVAKWYEEYVADTPYDIEYQVKQAVIRQALEGTCMIDDFLTEPNALRILLAMPEGYEIEKYYIELPKANPPYLGRDGQTGDLVLSYTPTPMTKDKIRALSPGYIPFIKRWEDYTND